MKTNDQLSQFLVKLSGTSFLNALKFSGRQRSGSVF